MKRFVPISCALLYVCWFTLSGCSTGPRMPADRRVGVDAWRYVEDPRTPPVSFSPEEIFTRSWKPTADRTVQLVRQKTFRVGEEKPVQILVAWFGSKGSDRTDSVDFYAAFPDKAGMRYYPLCHDCDCPPYNTQVVLEQTNPKRPSFRVSGNLGPRGATNNYSKWYYYELQPKWRMIRHSSDFLGAPSQ